MKNLTLEFFAIDLLLHNINFTLKLLILKESIWKKIINYKLQILRKKIKLQ